MVKGLLFVLSLLQRFNARKHHWSDSRVPLILEVSNCSLDQIDPASGRRLCSYDYKDMEGLTLVYIRTLIISTEQLLKIPNLKYLKIEFFVGAENVNSKSRQILITCFRLVSNRIYE